MRSAFIRPRAQPQEHRRRDYRAASPCDGRVGIGQIDPRLRHPVRRRPRRYLESLNAYARQFVQAASRPDVDAIFGIPRPWRSSSAPSRGGRKSHRRTLTEVHHFLRFCSLKLVFSIAPGLPTVPIEPQSEEAIAARILREYRGETVVMLARAGVNRKGVYTPRQVGCGKGYTQLRVDAQAAAGAPLSRIDRFKEHSIELPVG